MSEISFDGPIEMRSGKRKQIAFAMVLPNKVSIERALKVAEALVLERRGLGPTEIRPNDKQVLRAKGSKARLGEYLCVFVEVPKRAPTSQMLLRNAKMLMADISEALAK